MEDVNQFFQCKDLTKKEKKMNLFLWIGYSKCQAGLGCQLCVRIQYGNTCCINTDVKPLS